MNRRIYFEVDVAAGAGAGGAVGAIAASFKLCSAVQLCLLTWSYTFTRSV